MKKANASAEQLSVLREFVQPLPIDFAVQPEKLNWEPAIKINTQYLNAVSPTTEYSSSEDSE